MNNNHIDLNTLNQSSNKGHYSMKNNLKDFICNSNKEDNKNQFFHFQYYRFIYSIHLQMQDAPDPAKMRISPAHRALLQRLRFYPKKG